MGAYQSGVLRAIAKRHPTLRLPILTGISAGAVNTTFLAAQAAPLPEATDQLVKLWLGLTPDQVYNVHTLPLLGNVGRWGARLVGGGHDGKEPTRGLLDTAPLRRFLERALPHDAEGALPGIQHNIRTGRLDAVALSATSYTTGQSVTWVQGRDVTLWQRPQRRSELASLTVEHVMASSSLPMLFPAVRVGTEWYGDGGVRLTAPLSPALHLGATRILPCHEVLPVAREADRPLTVVSATAQVLSVLYNAIFLDLIDEDILRLERMKRLLDEVPPRAGKECVSSRSSPSAVARSGQAAGQFEPKASSRISLPHARTGYATPRVPTS